MTGLETLALEAAAKSLAGIFAKTGWDKGGQLLTWLGGGLDEKLQDIIFQTSQQYSGFY